MAGALGIGRFAYTPLLPDMVTDFGWSFAQAGDVASANFLGYMAGALIAPLAATSIYVRFWFAMSLMASVATTYLGAEAEGFTQWMALRFAAGVASAFCLVIVTTQLMQVITTERAPELGNIHFAGVGVGILVCVGALYRVASISQQWSRLGALAAVLLALAWFICARDEMQPAARTDDASGYRVSAFLWRLICGYGFFGFAYVVSATFIVAIASDLDSTLDPNATWLVVGVALIPSVYLWQWLANRFGTVPVLQVAYVVEAIGIVVTVLSSSVVSLLVGSALLGGTFAAITALGLSVARQHSPHRIAFTVSSMTVAFAFGQLVGPALAGRMADDLGGFLAPSLLAAGLLLIACVLLFSRAGDQH